VIFFQTLRTKYDNDVLTTGGSPLLLTAAVSAGKTTIDTAYEIDKITNRRKSHDSKWCRKYK
jgi:hypothetical protein